MLCNAEGAASCGARRLLAALMPAVVAFVILGESAWAQRTPSEGSTAALGSSLGELLATARRLNPEIAASRLDADAATARVDAAGRLPDPMFTVFSDQNRNRNGGVLPSTVGNRTYTVQQTFPLGGRRGLQREVAAAEARQAMGRQRATEAELVRRVKMVFAELYQAAATGRLTRDVDRAVQQLVVLTEARYRQGLATQQDLLRAQQERNALTTALIRLDGERDRLKIRLNALLNRSPGAALAEPTALAAMPASGVLAITPLLERVQRTNPILAMQAGEIDAADANRRLVGRSWYPDLTIGLGVVDNAPADNTGRRLSYEAMASINVPLNWGLREAQAREATARASAARTRHDGAVVQIEAELRDALRGLATLDQLAVQLARRSEPQARFATQSALSGYTFGRVDSRSAIETHHQLLEIQTERLRVEVERRQRLADIEFWIGEEL